MRTRHNAPTCFFMVCTMLLSISGCERSVETQNELDLSQITATGAQGPGDFTGNIDVSDWSPSSYRAIVFGSSFWLHRDSSSDTLFFGGRSAGDSSSQSLKIYNWGNSVLSVKLQPGNPFLVTYDSVDIQPSTSGGMSLYFIQPDTSSTVYHSKLTLRFSTQDSMIFQLRGSRVRPDTGGVVSVVPREFALAPAYPNPTDGEIRFQFAVPQAIDAVLRVVNMKNEVVATIAQGNQVAGVHVVSWNANLANGYYRVIFQAGSYTSKGDIRVLR